MSVLWNEHGSYVVNVREAIEPDESVAPIAKFYGRWRTFRYFVTGAFWRSDAWRVVVEHAPHGTRFDWRSVIHWERYSTRFECEERAKEIRSRISEGERLGWERVRRPDGRNDQAMDSDTGRRRTRRSNRWRSSTLTVILVVPVLVGVAGVFRAWVVSDGDVPMTVALAATMVAIWGGLIVAAFFFGDGSDD